MKVKSGVEPKNLWIACAIANVERELSIELTITSGHDSDQHMKTSKHYTYEALDIRTFDVPSVKEVMTGLRNHLGEAFQVILESDHIHVEYDPKAIDSKIRRA